MPLEAEQTAEKSVVDGIELLPAYDVAELLAVAQQFQWGKEVGQVAAQVDHKPAMPPIGYRHF